MKNYSLLALSLLFAGLLGCAGESATPPPGPATEEAPKLVAMLSTASPPQLNVLLEGEPRCEDREYEQPYLEEPVRILPVDGVMTTELSST